MMAALMALMSSCAGGFNILGHQVELVQNRNADGTYKPVNQVTNASGESPDAGAMLYHYTSGGLGVSAWQGGTLQGMRPNLRQ